MTLFEERYQRTWNAVRMKKVDKIPFSYNGAAYLANAQNMTINEFIHDNKGATDAAVRYCLSHPGIDTTHSASFPAHGLKTVWLSEVKIPGEELAENDIWQIHEKEVMTMDDYQDIIDMGYNNWLKGYLNRIGGDPEPQLKGFITNVPYNMQQLTEVAQVPFVNGGMGVAPMEGFCGGRGLMNFFMDIMEEPELVKRAIDVTFEETFQQFINLIEHTHPFGIWVGGFRSAPELISHDTWEEFCWPYIKKLAEAAVERNVLTFLHFDSNWDREIEMLKELPERSLILMTDGFTDLRRARAILGDHMCLMGDVPAPMLSYKSAEEVYNYVTRLIDDIGHDTGLIISSGCDIPQNARKENVDAMIQATLDYHVH